MAARRRREPRRSVIAAGYLCAVVLPVIGMVVAWLIARNQSRTAQRHATRMYVLALTVYVAGIGYLLLR